MSIKRKTEGRNMTRFSPDFLNLAKPLSHPCPLKYSESIPRVAQQSASLAQAWFLLISEAMGDSRFALRRENFSRR